MAWDASGLGRRQAPFGDQRSDHGIQCRTGTGIRLDHGVLDPDIFEDVLDAATQGEG